MRVEQTQASALDVNGECCHGPDLAPRAAAPSSRLCNAALRVQSAPPGAGQARSIGAETLIDAFEGGSR